VSAGAPGAREPSTAVFAGASAGGVETLVEMLSHVPGDLPAPVLVVLHVSRRGRDMLAAILDRAGPLPAVTAAHGDRLRPGVVYVAPRDHHLLVSDGAIALSDGPVEHGVRPAIDPLFRSAARCFGPGAVAVVLSGMLDDGTAGLREIQRHGGRTLVQDPGEALYPQMPESAIAHVDVDWVLPVAGIAAKVAEIVRAPPPSRAPAGTGAAAAASDAGPSHDDGPDPPGMRTDVTCPLCGGLLWETSDREHLTYSCSSGHSYSADTLLAVQGEGLDNAIWQPVRLLHQRGVLLRRMAARARDQGRERAARHYAEQAESTLTRADEMRRVLGVDAARLAASGDEDGGTG